MTTMTCPPAPLPLHRSWLQRLVADFGVSRRARRAVREVDADYADLAHLTEQTLRDIGAPDWVHERDRGAKLWQLERMRW